MEIIRQALDAFNRREIPAVEQYVDPDVEWQVSGYLLQEHGQIIKGRDEWLQFGELVFDTFEKSTIEVDEVIIVEPNKVVASGRLALRANEGDEDVIAPWVRIFQLRDGRILRSNVYPDRESALEAAEAA